MVTSQDGTSDDDGAPGGTSCGQNCVKYRYETDEGTGITRWYPAAEDSSDDGDATNGIEGAGFMESEMVIVHPDGSQMRTWATGRFDGNGNYTPMGGGSETVVPPLDPVAINSPSRQPADAQYGSDGEPFFFECFDPIARCIRTGG